MDILGGGIVMFRLALLRCAGVALVVLGVTACVCSLSAQDTARIDRWIAALQDKSPDVREAAALALLKQGAKAKAAVPALKKALKDEDANVRAAISHALLEIDGAVNYQDLLRQLADRKVPPKLRRQACRELARSDWDDEATATALEEMLLDADVKELAAAAIKYIRARRGVGPALVRTIPGGQRVVVFSPDGNTLATSAPRGGDSTVKLWDVLTGKEIASFAGHTGAIRRLEFSPDSKTLASRSDKETKLWDVATGKEQTTSEELTAILDRFNGYDKGAHEVSPDGKIRATIESSTVVLKNIRRAELARFKEHGLIRGAHSVFAFSPSGKTLACETSLGEMKNAAHRRDIDRYWAETARAIILLDVATKDNHTTLTPGVVFKKAPEIVQSVAFSSDGKTLATAGGNEKGNKGEIRLWHAATGRELASVQDSAMVQCVAFSPDGKFLASVGGGTIRLWATDVLLSARNKSN
jgi:hypothetical protein